MTDADQRYPDMPNSIDDKDHVFARFRSDKTTAADRRETLTIPGRTGASGSRVVQVVRMRSGVAIPGRVRRVRGLTSTAAWAGVFKTK